MASGFGGAGLRQLGGEIELVGPARQFLADDLALERGLHAVEHVLAGGVVRAHQERGLDALLVHVGADRGWRLVVVPRGREHVRRALIAGELRRAGIGHHRHGLGIDQRLERGQHHVRPDIADDEIDLVRLDQLLGFLHADFRLDLVVLVDDFDRQPADLAAEMVEAELERIAHVVADRGGRAAERRDEADLDGLLLRRCLLNHGRRRDQRQRGGPCNQWSDHRVYPSLSSRSTRGLLPAELVRGVVLESSAGLRNSTGACHGVSGPPNTARTRTTSGAVRRKCRGDSRPP